MEPAGLAGLRALLHVSTDLRFFDAPIRYGADLVSDFDLVRNHFSLHRFVLLALRGPDSPDVSGSVV